MNTNEPMTQERLDAIQARLDAVEVDPPDEYWSYGAGIAWVPFCLHARTDVPALLAEVDRLRARPTVTDDMVERAVKAHRQTFNAWPVKRNLEDAENRRVAAMRAALDAALNPQEGTA